MTHLSQPSQPRRPTRILAVITAAFLLIVGCSAPEPDADPRTGSRTPEISTGEIVGDAMEFGLIAITDGVSVLAASTDRGIDRIYQIALRTDQDGVDRFLSASNITERPVPATYLPFSILAGPPLEISPSIVKTSDHVEPEGRAFVYRSIVIDERDATTRYVHVAVFNT